MSKQIRRRIWSSLVALTMLAPVVVASAAHSQSSGTSMMAPADNGGQTGTDPEPTEPGIIIQSILIGLPVA
jgi:hypothetical protein